MDLANLFDGVRSFLTPTQNESEENSSWENMQKQLASIFHVPDFVSRTSDISESTSDQDSYTFGETPSKKQSKKAAPSFSGDSVTLAGYKVPKSFLEAAWKQECGSSFGVVSEKHRKGIVVRGSNGKADTKIGAKTYGPGLLYNPETGKLMQDLEPAGGYSTQELTRLFMVLMEKNFTKARQAGCKTWNQAAAYVDLCNNFGEGASIVKKINQMLSSGASDDKIANAIMHASDSQRASFPGLASRRMWEARAWIGDYDSEGHQSSSNKQKLAKLNPGTVKKSQFGGSIDRIRKLQLSKNNF